VSLSRNPQGGYRVDQVRRGSPAAQIGIQRGDLVLGVNGRALRNDEELKRAILDLRGRHAALIVVQRGASRYHLRILLS
jgi:serine protease Do